MSSTCSMKCPIENFLSKYILLVFFVWKNRLSRPIPSLMFENFWCIATLHCAVPFCFPIVWIRFKVGRGNSCGFHCLTENAWNWNQIFGVADWKKAEMLMMLRPFGEDDHLTRFIISAPKFALFLWFVSQNFRTSKFDPKTFISPSIRSLLLLCLNLSHFPLFWYGPQMRKLS